MSKIDVEQPSDKTNFEEYRIGYEMKKKIYRYILYEKHFLRGAAVTSKQ
jgi:hypothetical protein